ncbi:probable aquaporin NIP7-1 [Tanacetum coccineum]
MNYPKDSHQLIPLRKPNTDYLFKEDQICDTLEDVSTSNRSKFDQETGSSNTLERGQSEEVVDIRPYFLCFPFTMNKTLIRAVRNCCSRSIGEFYFMFSICGINKQAMKLMRGVVNLITKAFSTVAPIFSMEKGNRLYIVAQVAGSTLASFAGKLVYGLKSEVMTTRPLVGSSAAFWAEFMASFIVLFLTASLVHAPPSVTQFSGFIVAVGMLLSQIPVGSMNPARSWGPAIAVI